MKNEAPAELPVAPTSDQQSDGSGTKVGFELAKAVVVETATYIATEFAVLAKPERLRLVRAFRAGLIRRGKPGRKRRKEVTAAYEDWKLGMRGLELYSKHIPNWRTLAEWRRREKSRALLDAIRTRRRREQSRSRP